MTKSLLTAEEVAVILAVPRTWVYQAARSGAIPCITLGRYVRFDESDIARWIADRKAASR